MSTYEQARIFARPGGGPRAAELILYTYAMAAAWGGVAFAVSDEPRHAYAFVAREPAILAKMLASEVFGYLRRSL